MDEIATDLIGEPIYNTCHTLFYASFSINQFLIHVGDFVKVRVEDEDTKGQHPVSTGDPDGNVSGSKFAIAQVLAICIPEDISREDFLEVRWFYDREEFQSLAPTRKRNR